MRMYLQVEEHKHQNMDRRKPQTDLLSIAARPALFAESDNERQVLRGLMASIMHNILTDDEIAEHTTLFKAGLEQLAAELAADCASWAVPIERLTRRPPKLFVAGSYSYRLCV